eukprot:gene19665-25583_t
MKDRIFIRY